MLNEEMDDNFQILSKLNVEDIFFLLEMVEDGLVTKETNPFQFPHEWSDWQG